MNRAINADRIGRARSLCRILSAANVDGCELLNGDVQEVLCAVDELLEAVAVDVESLPARPVSP